MSIFWDFYVTKDGYNYCQVKKGDKFCNVKYKNNSSTTNMLNHLKSKHPTVLNKIIEPCSETIGSFKQYFKNPESYEVNSARNIELTECVLDFIIH